MKLREKCMLIVGTTLVCLLIILYGLSREVLLSGFAKVEHNDTERNAKRVLDAFTESVNNLSIKSADWSKWDDCYHFVIDGNKGFVESNLTDASLAELKLNLMLFFDTTGQLVFGRGFDMEEEKGVDVAPDIVNFVRGDTLLMRHATTESVIAGVAVFPDGPMNIVSRPILTSAGEGPIHGTLIFGRYLDSTEVNRIGQITHLTLTVFSYEASSLPPDVAQAKLSITDKQPLFINPIDKESIVGYARIADLHANPILLARIEVPREIYKQGLRTMVYLVISILAAGIIFGIVILVLLQKTVLSRVAHLSSDVNSIAAKGDHTSRVRIDGKDELTNLGSSVNSMLSALEQVEATVRSRNREMRMIMNTVPSGLLSIDENYRINPEYSRSVETILGKKELVGCDYFETIGLTDERTDDKKKLFDFLELLLQEMLPEREMAGLNPFEEYRIKRDNGNETWLRLRYFIIHRDEGQKKHLLVLMEDITEEKALAERVKQSEQENMQLKAIAEDPDLFKDFLTEMNKILTHAQERFEQLGEPADRQAIVNDVFRDVHTIKGTAGAFGLAAVVDISGQLEEALSPLRDSGEITPDLIGATKKSLVQLSTAVVDVMEGAKKILGEDFGDCADIHLRISLEKLHSEHKAIHDLVALELLDKNVALSLQKQIAAKLQMLRKIPARRGFAKALRIVPGLLKKFDKDVAFEVDGADISVDCEIARELNTPLIHLLRNAIDHGIEDKEARVLTGKDCCGHVRVTVCENDHHLVVQVEDDGKGLNPAHLKKAAIEKGILSEAEAMQLTDDDAYRLIFRPGFSTAETITEISGRGVGMDAVQHTVCEVLKGNLLIDSHVGAGTTFTLSIPVVDSMV